MDGIRMEQFPFRVLDYKAGEAWLNKLGAAGWRLEGIEKGRLRFRRTAEPVSYAVELEQFLGCLAERDFRTFCADAGWEKAGELGELVFYASAPGRSPAPLSHGTRPWRRSGSPGVPAAAPGPVRAAGWPLTVLPQLLRVLLFPGQELHRVLTLPGYGLLLAAYVLALLTPAAAEGRDVVWLLRCRRAGRLLTRSPGGGTPVEAGGDGAAGGGAAAGGCGDGGACARSCIPHRLVIG